LKKDDDYSASSIFHFGGFLLVASLVYFYVKLELGMYNPIVYEFYDWWGFVIVVSALILVPIDLFILWRRWKKYVPEAMPSSESPASEAEIKQLKEQIEQLKLESDNLKADSDRLTRDNEHLRETLASSNTKQNEYETKLSGLKSKEEDFARLKREWESQKHSDQLAASTLLRQKEADLEKQFNEKLHSEKEQLQERFHHKMTEFMDSVTEKLERRIHSEKKNIVEDIFKFDGHTKDDVFELKRTKESIEKEKEQLEKNKFLQEVDDRVIKSKEHVLEAKTSALDVKSENVELRSELKLMASEFKNELVNERSSRERSFDTVLHKLELEEERRKSDTKDVGNKIMLLAEQTRGKFIELTSMISDNLKDMEMRTMNSFREVRENLSDMKLQFGQEVLRLDGQQGQILNELEKYYIKNQEFVNKCQSLALESKSQNIDGHHLLNQVSHLYNQHKTEARMMENNLQTALDQVAVKEGNLANVVGESMLKLKAVSDQQYIAMKDMALEKKDINLLWKEKNQEHEMNLQEVRHQKQDLDRMKQFLDQEKSHFSENKTNVMDNARLTHQLYMNEQRYHETLKKVQSSQSFLGKIARAADFALSKG
jgi:hypothetical protein